MTLVRFFEYASPPKRAVHAHNERNDEDFKKQMPLHYRVPPVFPWHQELPQDCTALIGAITDAETVAPRRLRLRYTKAVSVGRYL